MGCQVYKFHPKTNIKMSTFKYKIDGKEYNVEIGGIDGNVANVVVNGEAFSVEMEKPAEEEKKKAVLGRPAAEVPENETAPSAGINTDNALKAPLPGIVTEIKVNVGDEVKEGDTLVVLEAMKMANNLDAEKSGKVKALCVKL